MTHVKEMIRSHPSPTGVDVGGIAECIDACFDCAQACTACADACLGEPQVAELVRCIRLNQDCFDVCLTTGNVLSRRTETDWSLVRAQVEACAVACQTCGAECASHSHRHEHCRVCADACRSCEAACRRVLDLAA